MLGWMHRDTAAGAGSAARGGSRAAAARRSAGAFGLFARLLCLVLVGGSPAAAAREPDPWYPIDVGREWVYREHSDRTIDPVEGALQRSFQHGRVTEKVVGMREPEGGSAPIFDLLRTQFRRTPGGGQTQRRSTLRFSAGSAGVLLHGLVVDDGLRSGGLRYRYEPAVKLLPPPAKRAKPWQAGTLSRPGIQVRLSGRVVGHEAVEVGGVRYPDCLHVRYDGSVASEIDGPQGRLVMKDGRYESDVWYSRGVGIVLEVSEIQGELTRSDGEVLRLTDVTSRRLQSHSAPR
jgi:hypothetical protein